MDISLALIALLLVFLAFALGSSVGSFLGVVIERRRAGESILGRSHCACGRPLRSSENIPVIGWLRIKGQAQCCGAKLPVWYLLLEVGLGLAAATVVSLLLF